MDSIRIIDIRLIDNGKPLKAFADVLVNGIEIRDFRVIQEPKCKAYVISPQTAWKGHQGKPNFKPIISMPSAIKWQIESAILVEYQKAKGKGNENNQSR